MVAYGVLAAGLAFMLLLPDVPMGHGVLVGSKPFVGIVTNLTFMLACVIFCYVFYMASQQKLLGII